MGKLKKVKPPEGALESIWVDPSSLTPNPDNWKIHTDDQTEVVRDSISKHGWLKPFVYNRRFDRLADGHDRLLVAIKEGYAAVPVWVGDWSEEEEAEILVTLDESARMAKGDPTKLNTLLERFKVESTPVSEMISRLSDREGVTAMLSRLRSTNPLNVKTPDEPETELPEREPAEPAPASPSVPYVAPVSGVRMVQIFLNQETFTEFNAAVEALAAHYQTNNTSDTVLAVLRDARESYASDGEEAEAVADAG